MNDTAALSLKRAFDRNHVRMRHDVASLRLSAAISTLRRQLVLERHYNPEQPRVPACATGGGQWTSGGSAAGAPGGDSNQPDSAPPSNAPAILGAVRLTIDNDATGEASWHHVVNGFADDGALAMQAVVNRDGSKILSEFNTGDTSFAWDERHTVQTPAGTIATFENYGDTQSIYTGAERQLLGTTTWTGQSPDAVVQPALAFAPAIPPLVAETIEAGLALYTWMTLQDRAGEKTVFAFNAREYVPDEEEPRVQFAVKRLTREETDEACPRHAEVQSRTDTAADTVKREGNYWSAAEYGTKVHTNLKDQIDALDDPNFKAEVSILKSDEYARYGSKGSVRIDVLEKVSNETVCVYDIKTGRRGLSLTRSGEIFGEVTSAFGPTTRIIVIETRPSQ